MSERNLEGLAIELEDSLTGLFEVTSKSNHEWGKGEYFCVYGMASKRLRAILDVEREVLFVGNAYDDQQQRTISFAQKIISESKGRLEPRVLFVVHRDPKGNSKLRKWGREAGLTIIPIYVGSGPIPKGRELERVLSFDFFSQDPFDITGPVASDAQFFGRRTEAQEFARRLQAGQIRSIFGIRKIGKASILNRIIEEVQSHYDAHTIFVDCSLDEVFNCHSAELICSIAATIEKAAANHLASANIEIAPENITLAQASRKLISVIEKTPKCLSGNILNPVNRL